MLRFAIFSPEAIDALISRAKPLITMSASNRVSAPLTGLDRQPGLEVLSKLPPAVTNPAVDQNRW
jgi:hypothetical protein